ncbi:MAG TPA: hypothetical protein VM733_06650 [Thermoanaerobaculia bacterium]|nr:hypothetical protein [Thermoanaerobaculia bacterium]
MKVRKVLRPLKEGDHVTVAEVRAAIRELRAEGKIPPAEPLPKRPRHRKATAKAE